MSSFQFGSYMFGCGMLGQATAYVICGEGAYAIASAIVGIVTLIASGFAAAAGDK